MIRWSLVSGLLLFSQASFASIPEDGRAALSIGITEAIDGLMSNGGEGDATPYRLVTVDLPAGTAVTHQLLLEKVLPLLEDMGGGGDLIPGIDEGTITGTWRSLCAAPKASEFADAREFEQAKDVAKKWRAVRKLFKENLTGIRSMDMGYRSSATGSLETGPVAHVILGVSDQGKLYAIYGIDIWT